MLHPTAIALIFAAVQFSLSAATIQTRDGKTASGSLQQLSEQGVRINGQTFSWGIIRKAYLAPAPDAKAELRKVKTKIWRGSFTTFKEVLTRDPSTIDGVTCQYVTVRRLGNTPGAILFEGRLNVPLAGDYQFRLASDDSARLMIGDKEVLGTPAEFSYRRATGSIRLTAGEHPFRLEYLNLASYAILELDWSGPGLAWTTLSAVKDWPLLPAPPAIPAAGALAWNGSYIAHPVESLTDSRVRFVGEPAGVRLTTVNAAAIFFQPLSLPVADRIRSGKVGREGVLLVAGDFLEGEILSIKNNKITLQTLLFGAKQYQGGSQASAVFLQKPAKAREQWVVRTQLGTEIRLRKLEWDGPVLIADQTPFRKLRLKADEIQEIAFQSKPNILERAWVTWGKLSEQEQQQAVAGQGRFDSIYKARAGARVYLAQLDEKWRRLESEHAAVDAEVHAILKQMQEQETQARKARANAAQTASDYALYQRKLHVNLHLFNPRLREVHELTRRRVTETKRAIEAEKKALTDQAKTNAEYVAKYQADRQRQQDGYVKHQGERKADYDKARGASKGDVRPVEITAAVDRARKVREFAESRRNRARDTLNQYTGPRDDARRQRDDAKRKVDAARGQRDARARTLQQAQMHEANVLKNGLDVAEKKMIQMRANYATKAAVYHELIGKESAVDQSRVDALGDLQSIDRHVRDWEGQLRSAQGKLRQDEQNKNNASRDYVRRRELMETARRTLHDFVDKQEQPALQRLNAVKERHDQLAAQVEKAPDDTNLAAQLKQAQEQLAKDLAALTALRGKLNGVIGQFQSKLHDFSYHQETSDRMETEWVRTQGDIKLLEKFLTAKKSRQAALRKTTGDLTRKRTDRQNRIRAAKGEMDRALTALNQALAEHNRRLAEYGTAITKRFEAARNLEDGENTLKREQYTFIQNEMVAKLRDQEWARRERVLKETETVFAASDRALKAAEAAKAGLKTPLDGDQNTLLGPLTAWYEAQEQVVHFHKETALEVVKMKGELEADRLRWAPSVTVREAALKTAETADKQAAAAHAKNLKDNEAFTQMLKVAEATDKAQQDKQTAANKALADASNNLRDARYRASAKEREWLEAVFQHERYRVQKRAVLGFE